MAEGERIRMIKRKKSPCLGCGMRFPGCHAVCIRFGIWRAGLDRINEDVRREKKAQADVTKVIDHGYESTLHAQTVRKRGRGR